MLLALVGKPITDSGAVGFWFASYEAGLSIDSAKESQSRQTNPHRQAAPSKGSVLIRVVRSLAHLSGVPMAPLASPGERQPEGLQDSSRWSQTTGTQSDNRQHPERARRFAPWQIWHPFRVRLRSLRYRRSALRFDLRLLSHNPTGCKYNTRHGCANYIVAQISHFASKTESPHASAGKHVVISKATRANRSRVRLRLVDCYQTTSWSSRSTIAATSVLAVSLDLGRCAAKALAIV